MGSSVATVCPPERDTALREVSFFTGRGAPENWGIRYFFLDQKGDQKIFSNKKGGSLIFFKGIKYFVKHFRTQWNSC